MPDDPAQEDWERSFGRGRSLFAGVAEPGPLELVSGAVFGNGTAGLIYRPLRRP